MWTFIYRAIGEKNTLVEQKTKVIKVKDCRPTQVQEPNTYWDTLQEIKQGTSQTPR